MRQKIDVICYAGYRADERPVSFIYRDKELKIEKIMDRSIEESVTDGERTYRFRVLCADSREYRLTHGLTPRSMVVGRNMKASGAAKRFLVSG